MFFFLFFFFKQKTAYELRISDWSSDVCSSDLGVGPAFGGRACGRVRGGRSGGDAHRRAAVAARDRHRPARRADRRLACRAAGHRRSEEHTSELQSLMRISYAVFCLKKKKHLLMRF